MQCNVMYVRTYVRMYVCMDGCMHACMYVSIYTYTHIHICPIHLYNIYIQRERDTNMCVYIIYLLYYIILYQIILQYVILYFIILYYIILYYIYTRTYIYIYTYIYYVSSCLQSCSSSCCYLFLRLDILGQSGQSNLSMSLATPDVGRGTLVWLLKCPGMRKKTSDLKKTWCSVV